MGKRVSVCRGGFLGEEQCKDIPRREHTGLGAVGHRQSEGWDVLLREGAGKARGGGLLGHIKDFGLFPKSSKKHVKWGGTWLELRF